MMMTLLTAPSLADKDKTSEIPELSFLEFLAEIEVLEVDLFARNLSTFLRKCLNPNKGVIPPLFQRLISLSVTKYLC